MKGFWLSAYGAFSVAVILTALALHGPNPQSQPTPSPQPSLQRDTSQTPRHSGPVTVAITLNVTPLQSFADNLAQEDVYGLMRGIRIVQQIAAIHTAQSETGTAIVALGGTIIGQNQFLVTRLLVNIDSSQMPALAALPYVSSVQIVPESSGDAPDTGRPAITDGVSR